MATKKVSTPKKKQVFVWMTNEIHMILKVVVGLEMRLKISELLPAIYERLSCDGGNSASDREVRQIIDVSTGFILGLKVAGCNDGQIKTSLQKWAETYEAKRGETDNGGQKRNRLPLRQFKDPRHPDHIPHRLNDDAMAPRAGRGDVVIYSTSETCKSGDEGMILLKSGKRLFRRVSISENGHVSATSYQPERYPLRHFDPKNIKQICRVESISYS